MGSFLKYEITKPITEKDFDLVKDIFMEYQQYLNVDLCFQSFESELNNLKNIYEPPKGTILIVKAAEEIVACVALKPIEENNCEMKRLYVKPAFRGNGLGQKLVESLIEFATLNKYNKMKLDTLVSLKEAVILYKKMGFVETKPYVYNPLNDVLYFEKQLEGGLKA